METKPVKVVRKLRLPIVWENPESNYSNSISVKFKGTPNAIEFQKRCDEFEIKNLIWKAFVDKKKNEGTVLFYKDCMAEYDDDDYDSDSDYDSDDD